MSNRILRIEAVCEKVGIPQSGVYRLMREGKFPQSIALSTRRSGFLESEIDDWIEARLVERNNGTRPQAIWR